MAPPRKKLSKEQVVQLQMLAGMGATQDEMSEFFSISVDTLHRRYAEDIKKGMKRFKASLRLAQARAAITDGNTAMLIWLGKQFLGQGDMFHVKHDVLHKPKFEGKVIDVSNNQVRQNEIPRSIPQIEKA